MSDEQLTQLINLKRAGSSWVKIQRETGINRRTAKRAYDKWHRSQNLDVFKEARKDAAAQAFRVHWCMCPVYDDGALICSCILG